MLLLVIDGSAENGDSIGTLNYSFFLFFFCSKQTVVSTFFSTTRNKKKVTVDVLF